EVAQRQVQALRGDRMQRVRGVADERDAAFGLLRGDDARERPRLAATDALDRAEPLAEQRVHAPGELIVRQFEYLPCVSPRQGPDERAARIREGQQRERAVRAEALPRPASMVIARRDVGDDGCLAVLADRR